MGQKKESSSREVGGDEGAALVAGRETARGPARRASRSRRRAAGVGVLTAVAVAGVVAGAVLTKMLMRARADRRWDEQVERFRAQGAL